MPVELADSYESIYRQAVAEMSAGNADEAIDLMLRIVHRLGRLQPETLERKPNLQQMLSNASGSAIEFLRWQKRYDEAIAVCESMVDRSPAPDDLRRRIASLTIEKGEVEEGLARLRQMAEESPSFASWVSLGAEHLVLKQYAEAEECYQSALSLAGSNEEAAVTNTLLFEIYRKTGRKEEALGAWNMALVLDANLGDHGQQVSRWLIEQGDLDEAAKYVERDRDPVRRTFYAGLLDWQAGRRQAAETKWKSILGMEVDEENPSVEAWMEAALRLDQPDKVIDLAEKFSAESRSTRDTAILLGIAHAMRGEVDVAQKWLDRVVVYLQRSWPSRDKIPAEKWELRGPMLPDDKVRQDLAAYFDVEESGM